MDANGTGKLPFGEIVIPLRWMKTEPLLSERGQADGRRKAPTPDDADRKSDLPWPIVRIEFLPG